jgi:hypothetical protein
MAKTLHFGGQRIFLKSSEDIDVLRNRIALANSSNDGWLFVDGEEADYHLHVPSGGAIFIRDDLHG